MRCLGAVQSIRYQNTAQLPMFDDYNMRAKSYSASTGRTFRFLDTPPLFYFGHGLGYTTFAFHDLTLDASTLEACEEGGLLQMTNTSPL